MNWSNSTGLLCNDRFLQSFMNVHLYTDSTYSLQGIEMYCCNSLAKLVLYFRQYCIYMYMCKALSMTDFVCQLGLSKCRGAEMNCSYFVSSALNFQTDLCCMHVYTCKANYNIINDRFLYISAYIYKSIDQIIYKLIYMSLTYKLTTRISVLNYRLCMFTGVKIYRVT